MTAISTVSLWHGVIDTPAFMPVGTVGSVKTLTPDDLRVTIRRAVKHLLVQRQARRLAEEKRQVRFQFISVLGHELKAPLAAIEGYLQILKDGSAGTDPAVLQQVIERALTRSGGMRRLIA